MIRVAGGYDGTVEEVDGRAAMVRLPSGASLRVRFGERVEHDGKRAVLAPPSRLWGAAADAETALRAWRISRASADGVPAYIVVSDKHLPRHRHGPADDTGRAGDLRRHRPDEARALRRRAARPARTLPG